MELEKTLRKARNALIGTGLTVALILGAEGCGTFLYSMAEGAGREAGREVVREVVREAKEENQEKKQEQIPRLRTDIFACNYFKDFNNNRYDDYPNEFVGIKNKFRDNEKILLVLYDEKSKRGQLAKIELYNPSGQLIYNREIVFQSNGNTWRLGEDFDMTGWLTQMGGYGNFKYVYYLDNKYVGSTEFEIVK